MVVDVHFGPCSDPGSTPGVSTVFLFIEEMARFFFTNNKMENSIKICLTEIKSVRIFFAHNADKSVE